MTTEQNEIKSAEWRKKNLSKNSVLADVSSSVYAFDVNKECYCSLCERHYKNYKRFVIHMKKAKHYC